MPTPSPIIAAMVGAAPETSIVLASSAMPPLLGGTLDARPRPGGGFRVVAHLPTGGEPA